MHQAPKRDQVWGLPYRGRQLAVSPRRMYRAPTLTPITMTLRGTASPSTAHTVSCKNRTRLVGELAHGAAMH